MSGKNQQTESVEHPVAAAEEDDDCVRQALQTIVDESIEAYIDSRRARIGEFVERNFSLKGAARLNRKAFGADLIKKPDCPTQEMVTHTQAEACCLALAQKLAEMNG